MSGIFSFFRSFFLKKDQMTQENKKKAKKKILEKRKRRGKHILNTSSSNPINIYVYNSYNK